MSFSSSDQKPELLRICWPGIGSELRGLKYEIGTEIVFPKSGLFPSSPYLSTVRCLDAHQALLRSQYFSNLYASVPKKGDPHTSNLSCQEWWVGSLSISTIALRAMKNPSKLPSTQQLTTYIGPLPSLFHWLFGSSLPIQYKHPLPWPLK